MVRLGAVYSGSKWQYDLFTSEKYGPKISRIIHACKLPSENLLDLDVILVPRESNQEMLLEIRDKLEEFLDRGKTLISFGEVTRPWLPNCVWESVYPKFEYKEGSICDKGKLYTEFYKIMNPDHPLLEGLTIEDLQWHFHGVFHAPKNARVLLRYGDADIIYIDSDFKGRILATTLDPDVHAGMELSKRHRGFLTVLSDGQ